MELIYYLVCVVTGVSFMAKRISIINFKGGIGKTTLSFQFAAGLARFHNARVLLMDMDHQSSLSIVSLGATVWQRCVNQGKTVNEIFKPFHVQGYQTPNASIIEHQAIKNPYIANYYATLDIVPSSLELDDIEIELTASHLGNAIQSEWEKRTLLCKWLEQTNVDHLYDYIIFDCPPATKIVSQNAIAASHGYIIPIVPEAVMERGAPHLVRMISNGIDRRLNALAPFGASRSIFVSNTQLVGLVITRIQTNGRAASGYTDDHTRHLDSIKRTWGNMLIEPYIVQGTGVSQALDDGVPVYDRSYTQNIGDRGINVYYEQVTQALKARVDVL